MGARRLRGSALTKSVHCFTYLKIVPAHATTEAGARSHRVVTRTRSPSNKSFFPVGKGVADAAWSNRQSCPALNTTTTGTAVVSYAGCTGCTAVLPVAWEDSAIEWMCANTNHLLGRWRRAMHPSNNINLPSSESSMPASSVRDILTRTVGLVCSRQSATRELAWRTGRASAFRTRGGGSL